MATKMEIAKQKQQEADKAKEEAKVDFENDITLLRSKLLKAESDYYNMFSVKFKKEGIKSNTKAKIIYSKLEVDSYLEQKSSGILVENMKIGKRRLSTKKLIEQAYNNSTSKDATDLLKILNGK